MTISNPSRRRIAAQLVIIALVLAAAGCRDQGASPTVTPPQDLLSPPAAATAIATPISPARIDATPLVEVTGLFSDPRPTHVDEQRSLGPKPTPVPWDLQARIVVDTQTGMTFNLGTISGGGGFTPIVRGSPGRRALRDIRRWGSLIRSFTWRRAIVGRNRPPVGGAVPR